jgi:hypothetical protein
MLYRLIETLRCLVAPFDFEAFAVDLLKDSGMPRQEAKIEGKIVAYIFRFVSPDMKQAFGPKIIIAALVYDRAKNNSRWNIKIEKIAAAAGVRPETLQDVINRGQKLTI